MLPFLELDVGLADIVYRRVYNPTLHVSTDMLDIIKLIELKHNLSARYKSNTERYNSNCQRLVLSPTPRSISFIRDLREMSTTTDPPNKRAAYAAHIHSYDPPLPLTANVSHFESTIIV